MSAPIVLDAATLAEAVGEIPGSCPLTAHELAIARLIADGLETPGIAHRLGSTEAAIASATTRLLSKTRSRTRAHLVARLMRAGRIH